MATVVLSAVGFVIGGPIGSAIGAVIGQQVDQRLFVPKGLQGPRLNDLKVQTSSYGTPIPRVYGSMRFSGTVIWSTDLQEDRRRVSNGKGKPKTTVYSYSASFAVALSSRPAGRIGRIWADSKLLRGTAGDFKTPTGFRFYTGDEGQAADPLIAAVEGGGNAPAYRGIAYAMFEDFQLEAYGNRIPSISFEVIADEGSVSVGTIFEDLSPDIMRATCPTLLNGFAAYGDSVAAVHNTLASGVSLYAADDGQLIRVSETLPLPIEVRELDLGTAPGLAGGARVELSQSSAALMPEKLTINYADPDRDFQSGAQHAVRAEQSGREERVELPAAIPAVAARRIAERLLLARLGGRKHARVRLPWSQMALRPGTSVTIPGYDDVWRITETRFEKMAVALELERVGESAVADQVADPGRAVSEPDLAHGPTTIRLLDLPPLDAGVVNRPLVAVAAAGASAGWRRASLLQSVDGGLAWDEAGSTAAPAIIGTTLTALAPGCDRVFDHIHAVEVELLNASMLLNNADDDGLLGGANVALAGGELLQFGRAEPIGPRRFRLSNFLRGRRGTQAVAHPAGTNFVMIDQDSMAFLDIQAGVAEVRVIASGVGDPLAGVQASLLAPTRATRPLSPVHLSATSNGQGGVDIRWVRRSRDGWHWLDNVDVPLGEEAEAYRLRFVPNVGAERIETVYRPEMTYSAAIRSADIAGGASSMTVFVAQIGTSALSDESSISFSL